MLDVFEDLHGVDLAIEDFGHDFHVAFWDALFVPQLFEVSEGLADGLLLSLFVFTVVGFVADLILNQSESYSCRGKARGAVWPC